jgi:hypothetical protein
VDAELAVKEGWWKDPDYILNELNINSTISSPAHDERVYLDQNRPYKMKGYAYSGGGRKITRVEVSFDGGVPSISMYNLACKPLTESRTIDLPASWRVNCGQHTPAHTRPTCCTPALLPTSSHACSRSVSLVGVLVQHMHEKQLCQGHSTQQHSSLNSNV